MYRGWLQPLASASALLGPVLGCVMCGLGVMVMVVVVVMVTKGAVKLMWGAFLIRRLVKPLDPVL